MISYLSNGITELQDCRGFQAEPCFAAVGVCVVQIGTRNQGVKSSYTCLLVSPFFYPEPISTGKYNEVLARTLVERGYQVDVYCSYPIYPSWRPEPTGDEILRINVFRGGLGVKYPVAQVLRRLLLESWFLLHVTRMYRKNRTKYDLIIPIMPPCLMMVAIAVMKPRRTRVMSISHDIQGILAKRKGSIFRGLINACIFQIEKIVYHISDHTVFLSKSMRQFAIARYHINKAKCSVCYPFVTISGDGRRNNLDQLFDNNKISIVYSGALGEKQAPAKLLELFGYLANNYPQFHCYVFSRGPMFDQLRQQNRNPGITFHDLVPENSLPELMMRSDIQVIPQEEGTSDAVLPSKLPNILASGTAVLAVADQGNEIHDLLSRYGKAISADRWDVQMISERVIEFVESGGLDKVPDRSCLDEFSVDNVIAIVSAMLA